VPTPPATARTARSSLPVAFTAGAAVGVLDGMIGLGGAEFRLPLLIMLFGFAALQAVILNKALSLVATALPARACRGPAVGPHHALKRGRQPAARQSGRRLGRRVLGHPDAFDHPLPRPGRAPGRHRSGGDRQPRRHAAPRRPGPGRRSDRRRARRLWHRRRRRDHGCGRRRAAHPHDRAAVRHRHQIAGSLSLAVSLPTMLVAFARYSRDATSPSCAATPDSPASSRSARSPAPSPAASCTASSPTQSSSPAWPSC
jgi:hypothetical protein